jgi:hypothetical protein
MRLFKAAAKSPALFSLGERLASMFWPVLRALGGKNVAGRLPRPSALPFRRRFT